MRILVDSGIALAAKGDADGVVRALKKGLEIDPGNPAILQRPALALTNLEEHICVK